MSADAAPHQNRMNVTRDVDVIWGMRADVVVSDARNIALIVPPRCEHMDGKKTIEAPGQRRFVAESPAYAGPSCGEHGRGVSPSSRFASGSNDLVALIVVMLRRGSAPRRPALTRGRVCRRRPRMPMRPFAARHSTFGLRLEVWW